MGETERENAAIKWREWMSREFTPEERMTIRMRLSMYTAVATLQPTDGKKP